MINRRQLLALASAGPLLAGRAMAQTSPSQAIRLIVPYVPGGGTDTLARLISPYIGDEFSQSVIVDNRGGGGSTIGTLAVARAQPDGQTIGLIDAAFVSNPALYRRLPYDSVRDFTPICLVATSPLVLCVHPGVEARSLKELVELARRQPGKLTFGSAGVGGATHIAGEQLRIEARIDIVHVPYKGAGQQLTDLLGGQTTMGFFVPGVAKAHIDAGRLRALGVTGSRSPLFPDIETLPEAGYPRVEASGMNGLVAPKGTPQDYVQRLGGAINRALATEALKRRLVDGGFVPAGGSPADFAAYLDNAMKRMAVTIQTAGIEPMTL